MVLGGKGYSMDPMVMTSKEDVRPSKCRRNVFMWMLFLLIVVALLVVILYLFVFKDKKDEDVESDVALMKGQFKNGAVASDGTVCSEVGRDILKQGGTAVDALVATEFCLSVVIPHSTGIGGGGFMVIYTKKTGKVEFLDFRETAPAFATEKMFFNTTDSSTEGGLAIGVPGFVKGLWEAWLKYGSIHWRKLVQPAIEIARNGYAITGDLNKAMKSRNDAIYKSPGFREIFFNPDGTRKQLGDTVKDEKQAKTLEKIRDHPTSFYYGSLAEDIIKDIQDAGGNITLDDLKEYRIKIREPIKNDIGPLTLYGASPPSSVAVVSMILNILKGYNFKPTDLSDISKSPLTYHRFAEAFKFGYAWRALLGDPDYSENVTETVKEMLNHNLAEQIRKKINDSMTYGNVSHYGGYYANKEDYGTSHTSILAKNGDAVACTSTINLWFGSKVKSNITGIGYNNEMDDFSTPGTVNAFGFPASKYNYIVPGKRPMSSMSPTIVIDKNGQVRVVAGGSGGSRIITGTTQVIMDAIWFGLNAVEAVNHPRIHHQLLPDEIRYMSENPYKIDQKIIDFLKERKHNVKSRSYLCHTQAITNDENGRKFAMSDVRKDAKAFGY